MGLVLQQILHLFEDLHDVSYEESLYGVNQFGYAFFIFSRSTLRSAYLQLAPHQCRCQLHHRLPYHAYFARVHSAVSLGKRSIRCGYPAFPVVL